MFIVVWLCTPYMYVCVCVFSLFMICMWKLKDGLTFNIVSLWACQANRPTSFQGLSCLLLPSYHRTARMTNVHQGLLLSWSSQDRHWNPYTYKVSVLLSHLLDLMPAFPCLCWTGSEQKGDSSSWHKQTPQLYYTLNHSLNFNWYGTQFNTSMFCTKGLRNQVYYKILFGRI